MTNLERRKSKNVSYNPSTFALDQLSTQTHRKKALQQVRSYLTEIVADDKRLIWLITELQAKFLENGDLWKLVGFPRFGYVTGSEIV